MPTVLIINGLKLRFYSTDESEPPHVHVVSGNGAAKFWLDPVKLHTSKRYNNSELREIEELVTEHQGLLLGSWYAFFQK